MPMFHDVDVKWTVATAAWPGMLWGKAHSEDVDTTLQYSVVWSTWSCDQTLIRLPTWREVSFLLPFCFKFYCVGFYCFVVAVCDIYVVHVMTEGSGLFFLYSILLWFSDVLLNAWKAIWCAAECLNDILHRLWFKCTETRFVIWNSKAKKRTNE